MLKNFNPRLYQQTILHTAVNYNTLVVLPTGMGKTGVAVMLAAQRLKQYPNSKILVLAPTKPLVEQIKSFFQDHIETTVIMFTGQIKSEKRAELWKSNNIIISTPQGLENDIINQKIDLKDISLLIVDEAHRAIGDYSYVWIAKQYHQKALFLRILALTASPGSDIEKITEITQNLFVEEVEVRTSEDPDVKPYIQHVNIKWIDVQLPESFKEIKKFLDDSLKSKLEEIKKNGFLSQLQVIQPSKIEILKLQGMLHGYASSGEKSFEILKSMSLAAEAMKIFHALELIQSQGVESLHQYMDALEKQALTSSVKAVQNLVKDLNFRSALIKTKVLKDMNIVHPKMDILRAMIEKEIEEDINKKIIIFSQYRDTVTVITEHLKQIPNVKPEIFVGQAKRKGKGLSQKQQLELLQKFKDNSFNVLVSSSVGEEGLDIPAVDLVVFYEPVPSAIRHIQRRGRTGRLEKGRVVVLCAKGTIDEGYRWSAHHKEKRMHRILQDFKTKFKPTKHVIKSQELIPESKLKIFCDHREKGNLVIKELIEQGINIKLEQLKVGDYIVSTRVGIEYKKVEDFVNSILDGRLLEQAKQLKINYERPLFIIEGEQDLYSVRNIHPNAIRGMLSTIAISYGIPVIRTKNYKDTASMMQVIAKREQEETNSIFMPHGSNKPKTLKEQQEYLVSALPGVGANLCQPLLFSFGSIKKIINASAEDLMRIDKIGEKKANDIKKLIDLEYGI